MVIASFLTRSLIVVSLGRLGSRFETNNELRNKIIGYELVKINMINKRLLISIILQDKSSHNLSNSF